MACNFENILMSWVCAYIVLLEEFGDMAIAIELFIYRLKVYDSTKSKFVNCYE